MGEGDDKPWYLPDRQFWESMGQGEAASGNGKTFLEISRDLKESVLIS